MHCPFCDHSDSRVVDSRASANGRKVRRRRECPSCERRFTTYERIEEFFPRIVKSDGSREDYKREKIRRGVELACTKRPISTSEIDEVVDNVEQKLIELSRKEVSSDWIGSTVTKELRDLDPVAYIRFASVYRAFNEIQEFLAEVRELDVDEPSRE
jgi:transcriptional repressor NrdR